MVLWNSHSLLQMKLWITDGTLKFAVFTEPYDATCTSDTFNCKDRVGERLKFLRVAITTDDGAHSESDEFECSPVRRWPHASLGR